MTTKKNFGIIFFSKPKIFAVLNNRKGSYLLDKLNSIPLLQPFIDKSEINVCLIVYKQDGFPQKGFM